MSRLCVATIASANYLAYVEVLRDSLAQHVPDARFEVLVVDRPGAAAAEAVAKRGLSVTYAQDLGIADFEHIAYKFDVVELNTALKPTFLKRLLDQGCERVIYLDPDIEVFAPLAPVMDALDQAEIALIPHSLAPVMDGLRPSDIDYLRMGTFNLGFVAVRNGPQARAMLDWWEARCLGWGFNDFTFGVFVDQKWMDLVPSYFDSLRIIRHRGCNVAYWNLHERSVDRTAAGWTVSGEPLVFFHFSGVNALAPGVLSRHQNRHSLTPGSPLAALVARYCDRLLQAGHAQLRTQPYGYGQLDDGTPLTSLMRRASCAPGMPHDRPFAAASALQRQLRAAGLVSAPVPVAAGENTLNFDPETRAVRWVNAGVRLLARLAGAARVAQLLRYATFLGWGVNLPAVLLRRPFDLTHSDPRASAAPPSDPPPRRTP